MRSALIASSALILSALAFTGCAGPSPTGGYTPASISITDSKTGTEERAWEVWDYSGGPSKLKIDTSRGFRVEFMGSAADYPQDLADTDLAIVGKDGHWYVFRAVSDIGQG